MFDVTSNRKQKAEELGKLKFILIKRQKNFIDRAKAGEDCRDRIFGLERRIRLLDKESMLASKGFWFKVAELFRNKMDENRAI